jgi:hypothetical protein
MWRCKNRRGCGRVSVLVLRWSLRRWSSSKVPPLDLHVPFALTAFILPAKQFQRVPSTSTSHSRDNGTVTRHVHSERRVYLTASLGKPTRASTEPTALSHHRQCCQSYQRLHAQPTKTMLTSSKGEVERGYHDAEQESTRDQHPKHGHRTCSSDVQELPVQRSFPLGRYIYSHAGDQL